MKYIQSEIRNYLDTAEAGTDFKPSVSIGGDPLQKGMRSDDDNDHDKEEEHEEGRRMGRPKTQLIERNHLPVLDCLQANQRCVRLFFFPCIFPSIFVHWVKPIPNGILRNLKEVSIYNSLMIRVMSTFFFFFLTNINYS